MSEHIVYKGDITLCQRDAEEESVAMFIDDADCEMCIRVNAVLDPSTAAPVADGDLTEEGLARVLSKAWSERIGEPDDPGADSFHLSQARAVLAVVDGRVQAAEAERADFERAFLDAVTVANNEKLARLDREAVIAAAKAWSDVPLEHINGNAQEYQGDGTLDCILDASPLSALHEYGAKVLEDAAANPPENRSEHESQCWFCDVAPRLRARAAALRTPTPTDLGEQESK